MAKRKKNELPPREAKAEAAAPAVFTAHPPARQPTLLAVSVALFALWFLFLLVAAIWG
jgi:hypothetical protein